MPRLEDMIETARIREEQRRNEEATTIYIARCNDFIADLEEDFGSDFRTLMDTCGFSFAESPSLVVIDDQGNTDPAKMVLVLVLTIEDGVTYRIWQQHEFQRGASYSVAVYRENGDNVTSVFVAGLNDHERNLDRLLLNMAWMREQHNPMHDPRYK